METKTGKRIVRGQIRRLGLLLAGLYKILVSGIGLGGGIFLFVRLSIRVFNPLHEGVVYSCFGLALAVVFLAFGIYTTYESGIADIQNAVKTTSCANTADLPVPDTLVRASSEPLQTQEAVLLRAATKGNKTQTDELMRASAGQE